jgi:hypothetical protein
MSGPGGGGGDTWRPNPKPTGKPKSGGGGGGDTQPDPCAISEITNLNSVDRAVLATVRVGDVLAVVYLAGPPRRLVVQTRAAGIVGSRMVKNLKRFEKAWFSVS